MQDWMYSAQEKGFVQLLFRDCLILWVRVHLTRSVLKAHSTLSVEREVETRGVKRGAECLHLRSSCA